MENFKRMFHEDATHESSGTFKKTYVKLEERNQILIFEMKCLCEQLETLLKNVNNREKSLFMTNLEQASMWGTKAIVNHDANQFKG